MAGTSQPDVTKTRSTLPRDSEHLAAVLHDGHLQHLAAVGLRIAAARALLAQAKGPEAANVLAGSVQLLDDEIDRLRTLIARLRNGEIIL